MKNITKPHISWRWLRCSHGICFLLHEIEALNCTRYQACQHLFKKTIFRNYFKALISTAKIWAGLFKDFLQAICVDFSCDISVIHHSICIPLPWASGLTVAIQCAWNLDPSVHWNATGERIVGCQCASNDLPVVLQWSSSVFQLCKLTLDRHWDTTGC